MFRFYIGIQGVAYTGLFDSISVESKFVCISISNPHHSITSGRVSL